MTFPEGSVFWQDQLRSLLIGEDPELLAEWSGIIEKRANDNCKDSAVPRITFRVSVDNQGKFAFDIGAPTPQAMLCLLDAIQDCLDLMPTASKRFYAAFMDILAEEADKRDETRSDS